MNKERVARIIADIERFYSDLKGLKIDGAGDLKGKERFYAVSMILFSIVNRAIDLGEELVAARKLGMP